MAYNTILVPLDGSHLAEYVLPQVETVASAFSSKVTLFHVVDAARTDPEQLTPSQRRARADIVRYLKEISARLGSANIQVDWGVSFGDPAAEIIRRAETGGFDLVTMSTHGRGGSRPETGSVAMAVVSATHTPVLLVRPPEAVANR